MASIIDMPLVRRLKKIVPFKAIKKALKIGSQRRPPAVPAPQRLVPASTDLAALSYLPASLKAEQAGTLRGAVDSVTGTDGIVGWLIDMSAPGKQFELELIADGQVIATTETALYRDDLALPRLPEARPGFRFAPGALVALLDEGRPPFSRLAVRVARQDAYLSSNAANLSEAILSAAQSAAALEPDVTFLDPFDFSLHLHRRRQLASALLGRPFRPQEGTFDGYIEIVAPLNADTLMFVGWMKASKPIDFAGVIVADRKYPAAFSGRTFSRPDLQKPSVGWVSFVRTDWRPSPGNEITVYWGMAIPFYLHGNVNMRVISPAEAGFWIAGFEGKLPVREYGEFHSNLSKLESWVSGENGLKEAGITYGIDTVLVLPGFGALIAGWITSPYKRLHNLTFRTGQQVAAGDRRTLSLVPRFDPTAEKALPPEKTGSMTFRCAARALIREGDLQQPMLRFTFEDGSAFAVQVPRHAVRVADGSEALGRAVRFFPALVHETFIDEFAQAYQATIRQRAAALEPGQVARSPRVAVMVLPRQADDLQLALADIRRSSALLPPDVGVALVTSPKQPRARIYDRLAELGFGAERLLSLFELNDTAYALWSLGAVLSALGTERFWFCGPDAVPTQAGWRAAATFFAEGHSDLEVFLRPHDGGTSPEPDSLSFAWETQAFSAWAASAPFFLGGFHRDNRLPDAARRHEGAIGLLRTMVSAEPIRRVDERLYRASAQGGALTVAAS